MQEIFAEYLKTLIKEKWFQFYNSYPLRCNLGKVVWRVFAHSVNIRALKSWSSFMQTSGLLYKTRFQLLLSFSLKEQFDIFTSVCAAAEQPGAKLLCLCKQRLRVDVCCRSLAFCAEDWRVRERRTFQCSRSDWWNKPHSVYSVSMHRTAADLHLREFTDLLRLFYSSSGSSQCRRDECI